MGAVESPKLVGATIGRSFKFKSVLALSKTEEMLFVHVDAQTNSSIYSTTDRPGLVCWDRAVNVTTSDRIDLRLQSCDVISIRTVHVRCLCLGLGLKPESVIIIDGHSAIACFRNKLCLVVEAKAVKHQIELPSFVFFPFS